MDVTMPDWDAATEARYEEHLSRCNPTVDQIETELEFLNELLRRNDGYPGRSPEADDERREILRDMAAMEDLLPRCRDAEREERNDD